MRWLVLLCVLALAAAHVDLDDLRKSFPVHPEDSPPDNIECTAEGYVFAWALAVGTTSALLYLSVRLF